MSDAAKQLTFNARARTSSYRPNVIGHSLQWFDGNQFSWLYVDRMRRDPQIRLAESVLRAPMQQVKWHIHGRSDVGRFVHRSLLRFWRRGLGKAMAEIRYGHQPAEITYREEEGKIQFDRFLDVHPLDAKPLQFSRGSRHGEIAGVRFTRVMGRHTGHVDLQAPNAAWFTHQQMYGQLYGQSRYEGAFLPWMEKRGRHGASDIRRIWFLKNAFNGGVIRYPDGQTEISDGRFINNQDLARQLIEKLETGGILVMPNTRDEATNEFEWIYEPPKPNGNIDGMLEYYDTLDHEILRGMNIPPEMVDASTVGSGYSGRAIPAQMFFSSLDEWVAALIDQYDRFVLSHIVKANFGRRAAQQYEIEPYSLAELVARDPGDAGKRPEESLPQNPLGLTDAAASGTPIRMSRESLVKFLRGPSIPSRWDEPAMTATIDPRITAEAKAAAREHFPGEEKAGTES